MHKKASLSHSAVKVAVSLVTIVALPVLMVIAVVGAIVVTGLAAIKTIVKLWAASKPIAPAHAPSVKPNPAPVPSEPNPHAQDWGDVDWTKIAVCDPTKKVGTC